MSWTCDSAGRRRRRLGISRTFEPFGSIGPSAHSIGPVSIFLAVLLLSAGFVQPAEAQRRNAGLLNIRDLVPTARVLVHGTADSVRFSVDQDTLRQWLTAAIDTNRFGGAVLADTRSDSMAYLDVNLQVVPRADSTYLATAIFQVLRPGYVINIPAEEARYDVPVLQTAFTLEGTEFDLRRQMRDLIGQYVRFSARRIRQHNPGSEAAGPAAVLPGDTTRTAGAPGDTTGARSDTTMQDTAGASPDGPPPDTTAVDTAAVDTAAVDTAASDTAARDTVELHPDTSGVSERSGR